MWAEQSPKFSTQYSNLLQIFNSTIYWNVAFFFFKSNAPKSKTNT